ncbi:MAG: hypothetical protein WC630_05580 [Candidatus Babeliales bacterium]
MNIKNKVYALIVLSTVPLAVIGKITFTAATSTLKVSGSAKIVPKTKLTITTGTLSQGKNAKLEGNNYTFDNGSLTQETGSKVSASTCTLNPKANTLASQKQTVSSGGKLTQKVVVSGKNASLEGFAVSFSKHTIILADADTILEYSVISNQPSEIILHGGTVKLFNDLKFSGTATLVGSGLIDYNDRALWLDDTARTFGDVLWHKGADIEMCGNITLTSDWIFTGTSSINGHGCVLDLSQGGEIVIDRDSKLFLNDVHITGLGNTAGKIILRNADSVVLASNSTFRLDDNLTTSNGTFYMYGGPSTFLLGPVSWTFDTGTGNIVVDGTTLWLDCLNSPLVRGKVYAPLAVPTNQTNLAIDLASGHLSLLNRGTIKEAVDANFTFSGTTPPTPNPDEIIFDDNVSGTISLAKCVCVGKDQTIRITGNATLDGNGACIYFSTDPRAQLTVMPDTILTLSNICLCHMHQDVLDLRDRSRIKIGANVHWGMINDITFTANAQIGVENTELGANIFTLCGEAGRAMFNVRPEVPVFEDIFTYNRPNQTFRLGHNTLQLDSAGVSGLDYIYFYNDVDFSAAIALSGNSAVDIDSRYTARQVYREDDALTEPFIALIGQNDYGTAMNFFVEGSENDLILHKDGLILGGNVAFGDDPSNDLHVHMNAPELYNPAVLSNEERAKARAAYETMLEVRPNEQFPFVMFSGDPGMYLYSQDGLAHLDFFDRDAAAVIETTNSFEVDDNSLLTYNRLWLLYNPIKQYSRIFRSAGFELIGEGLDPSFIRMPRRALSGNIAPSAIYKKRQYDKMMLVVHQRDSVHKVKQDKIDQYINAQPKQKKIAKSKHGKNALHRGIDLSDDEVRAVTTEQPRRTIHPPLNNLGAVRYDQPVWKGIHDLKAQSGLKPLSGNLAAQDATIKNFSVDNSLSLNLSLLGNAIVELGADVDLINGTHIINIVGTGNVIKLKTYNFAIDPNTFYFNTNAAVTFEFPDEGAQTLTIKDSTQIDLENGSLLKVSGPGRVELADGMILNFKNTSPAPAIGHAGPKLVLTDRAVMSVVANSTANILGIGSVIVEQAASILLDAMVSKLLVGRDTPTDNGLVGGPSSLTANNILFYVTHGGQIWVEPVVLEDRHLRGDPSARFSAHYATTYIKFENGATLGVGPAGVFEVNSSNASNISAIPGNLVELAFNRSSLIVSGGGIFALGDNQGITPTTFSYDGLEAYIDWDTASDKGPGFVRYVNSDADKTITGRITYHSDDLYATIPDMTSQRLMRALMNRSSNLTSSTLLLDMYGDSRVWTVAGFLSDALDTNDVIDDERTVNGAVYVDGHNSKTSDKFTVNPDGSLT